MTMPNASEIALLQLILQNVDWTNIGDAGGLRGSATPGQVFIALCKGDPGETGDLATQEIVAGEYGEYARVGVDRSAVEWEDNGANGLQNANAITFVEMATGSGVTATYFAICKADVEGANDAIVTGQLTGGGLAISNGITPQFAAGDLDVTAD